MKKYSTLLLIILFATLLLTQQKIIMPLVYDVIKSDFFLVDSKDQASQLPISSHLTDIAFINCNKYIKSKVSPDIAIIFPDKPLNAWSLGNYQYIINAEISVADKNATISLEKYVCRIAYNNGDDQEGIEDPNNWTISGISGVKGI